MKILITGSGGLIGREITYQLSKNKKYDLNLLSNKRINNNKKNFHQNLLKPIKLKLKPHAIIHCAAKHPNSRSGSNMKNIYFRHSDRFDELSTMIHSRDDTFFCPKLIFTEVMVASKNICIFEIT